MEYILPFASVLFGGIIVLVSNLVIEGRRSKASLELEKTRNEASLTLEVERKKLNVHDRVMQNTCDAFIKFIALVLKIDTDLRQDMDTHSEQFTQNYLELRQLSMELTLKLPKGIADKTDLVIGAMNTMTIGTLAERESLLSSFLDIAPVNVLKDYQSSIAKEDNINKKLIGTLPYFVNDLTTIGIEYFSDYMPRSIKPYEVKKNK